MVRLGTKPKKTRSTVTAGENGKPLYITTETVIGQVSPDLISSYFAPKIKEVADQMKERYAADLLDYEDHLKETQAEVDQDGTIPGIDQLYRPLFYTASVFHEWSEIASDTSEHFFAKKAGWKIHANAARFERMLDERYGIFRPFITNHPEIERFVRGVQRKYAMGAFSPFRQGDPPIPRGTAIIILFMMQRGGVRWEIMVLATMFFLIGLQPWALVAVVVLLHHLLMRRQCRPISTFKSRIPAVGPYYESVRNSTLSVEEINKRKQDALLSKVGSPLPENIDLANCDTIIIGHGPGCLYTASLLTRAGRTVLVLSPRSDASGCLQFQSMGISQNADKLQNIPFDIEASNIAKITRQQEIIAPALSTTTDFQGGVRFSKIGTEMDGYTFEILSIPGLGTDNKEFGLPMALNASGAAAIMEEAASYLGDGWPDMEGDDGNSTTGSYLSACRSMNASAGLYYLSKILPDSINDLRASSTFQESAVRYTSSFLNKCFPYNAHLRSFMAGIGMRGENIKPGCTSMAAHVSNISSVISGEGMHYPIGGPRALCKAFANVVERCGGHVYTDAIVEELLFDEDKTVDSKNVTKPDEGPPPPRCVGVQLVDGRQLRFQTDRYTRASSDPVVISYLGFIDTFVRLLREEIRSKYKVPRGLPALSERRPVLKILFALRGNAADLDLTGADYVRLPNASVPLDIVDPATGAVTYGEIGGHDDGEEVDHEDDARDLVQTINTDPSSEGMQQGGGKKKGRKYKFNAGVSWVHISFPSAKDPSFETRHGKFTTCVVTIEADDDFVTSFDTKPRLFVVNKETAASHGDKQRLLDRVTRDLIAVYPQLEGKIEHSEIRGPFQRGLSHNPERYAAKGVRADTPYPRLYVGGSDLTVGDSFSGDVVSGWLVANSVIGYNALDLLFLEKNVTADIVRFLDPPELLDVDDLAVPYQSPVQSNDADSEKPTEL